MSLLHRGAVHDRCGNAAGAIQPCPGVLDQHLGVGELVREGEPPEDVFRPADGPADLAARPRKPALAEAELLGGGAPSIHGASAARYTETRSPGGMRTLRWLSQRRTPLWRWIRGCGSNGTVCSEILRYREKCQPRLPRGGRKVRGGQDTSSAAPRWFGGACTNLSWTPSNWYWPWAAIRRARNSGRRAYSRSAGRGGAARGDGLLQQVHRRPGPLQVAGLELEHRVAQRPCRILPLGKVGCPCGHQRVQHRSRERPGAVQERIGVAG